MKNLMTLIKFAFLLTISFFINNAQGMGKYKIQMYETLILEAAYLNDLLANTAEENLFQQLENEYELQNYNIEPFFSNPVEYIMSKIIDAHGGKLLGLDQMNQIFRIILVKKSSNKIKQKS